MLNIRTLGKRKGLHKIETYGKILNKYHQGALHFAKEGRLFKSKNFNINTFRTVFQMV